MTERKETAADIYVQVGEERLAVTQLSVTKDISIDEIYGAGNMMPSGFGVQNISYSGDMAIPGNRKDLEDKFFDDNGVPVTGVSVTITHRNGESTVYNDILVTSEGWEMNDGETTETSFEFIAMSKDDDTEPSGLDGN